MEFPEIRQDDIILCGSIYAVTADIRRRFAGFISRAKENDAIVVYDPNFRKSHLSDLEKLRPLIIENMQMSVIVRASDEDFENIFGVKDANEAYSAIKEFCSVLVYTSSKEGVFVRTPGFSGQFPVRKIKPVSTIGAGDNFNAGMITALFTDGITSDELQKLDRQKWDRIVSTGVDFATEVCMSYENYISRAFASRYLSASGDHI